MLSLANLPQTILSMPACLLLMLQLVLLLISVTHASKTECCTALGVSVTCAQLLCDPGKPPSDMDRYSAFGAHKRCQRFLPQIATCLADERDSSACCLNSVERPDLANCLGLCKGRVSADISDNWPSFRSCLVLNLSPIMKCVQDAYATHPSAPKNIRISSSDGKAVEINWNQPGQNAGKVKFYQVHLASEQDTKKMETSDTAIRIDGLNSARKYIMTVVAIGEEGTSSIPSESFSFTTKTPTKPVYAEVIRVGADEKSTTLPCHLENSLLSERDVVWEKEKNGKWAKLTGSRYLITSYYQRTANIYHYVSSLEINDLGNNDYGKYRCHVEKDTTAYGEISLDLYSFTESEVPSLPPETVFECCSKVPATEPECESVCHAGPGFRPDVKPGAFLPMLGCFESMNTLIKCTLRDRNRPACCIQNNIPYNCLGLCDSRFPLDNIMLTNCTDHLDKIVQCQSQNNKNLPYGVSKLRGSGDPVAVNIDWESSDGAEVYHVYHRKEYGTWSSGATTRIHSMVQNADEVAVVAVNKYGYSSGTRLRYVEGEWVSQYLY